MRIRPHLFHLAALGKIHPGTVRASTLPARGRDKIATALSSSAAALPKAEPSEEECVCLGGGGGIKYIKHHNHLPPPSREQHRSVGKQRVLPKVTR